MRNLKRIVATYVKGTNIPLKKEYREITNKNIENILF